MLFSREGSSPWFEGEGHTQSSGKEGTGVNVRVPPQCAGFHAFVFTDNIMCSCHGQGGGVWTSVFTKFSRWDIRQIGDCESPGTFKSQTQEL